MPNIGPEIKKLTNAAFCLTSPSKLRMRQSTPFLDLLTSLGAACPVKGSSRHFVNFPTTAEPGFLPPCFLPRASQLHAYHSAQSQARLLNGLWPSLTNPAYNGIRKILIHASSSSFEQAILISTFALPFTTLLGNGLLLPPATKPL